MEKKKRQVRRNKSVCEKCGKETKELLDDGMLKCYDCTPPWKKLAFFEGKNTKYPPEKVKQNISNMYGGSEASVK